ncbi:MAG: YfhO family protein [Clostridiales bacterium]|nr:YfhO family protein [Clostridiales bacterium]
MSTEKIPSADINGKQETGSDRFVFHKIRDVFSPQTSIGRGGKSGSYASSLFLYSSFLIPVIVITIILIFHKVHPFGPFSIFDEKMYEQYIPLLTELRRKILSGESLFYSWNIGFGVNFFAFIGTYLASPLNLLVLLFPEAAIPDAITLQVLLRVGLSGLGFAWFIREKDRINSAFLPALASAYALGGYMLAYSLDITLADAVVILPFVLLGAWRIIRGERPILFVGSLLLLILSAWRASIYIGMFLILFIPLLYFEAGGSKLPKPSRIPLAIRFLLYAVLAVCGAAIVIIPAFSALQMDTAAGSGDFRFPEDLKMYFTFFDLGDRMLFRTAPEWSLRMPNIYCGAAVFVLVPLYAFCEKIAFRERVYSLTMLGFLYVTMSGSLIDYALNGLALTERDHFRQAFLFSFLLLYMSARAVRHAQSFSRKAVTLSLLGVFIFLVLDDHSGELQRAWQSIYGTAALAFVYGLCMRALSGPVRWHRTATAVFSAVVIAELAFSAAYAADIRIRADGQAEYKSHGRYAQIVREGVETAERQSFFRLASDMRFTDYDGAYGGNMCPDAPTSLISGDFSAFAQNNGFGDRSPVRIFAPGINEVTGMLLGIQGEMRFIARPPREDAEALVGDVIGGENGGEHPILDQTYYRSSAKPVANHPADRIDQYQEVELTRNTRSLSVAYRVDPAILEVFDLSSESPFTNNNSVLRQMGVEPLYTDKRYEMTQMRGISLGEDGRYTFSGQAGSASFVLVPEEVTEGERFYLYVETERDTQFSVRTFSHGEQVNIRTFTLQKGRIADCGLIPDNQTEIRISVTFPSVGSESFSVLLASVSEECIEEVYARLGSQSLQIDRLDGAIIRGKIDAKETGALFFSVPYDSGWSVRVDGQPVSVLRAAGSWLSVPIWSGSHEIEARYVPPGFVAGALVTLCAAVLFVLLLIRNPGHIMGFSKSNVKEASAAPEVKPSEMNAAPPEVNPSEMNAVPPDVKPSEMNAVPSDVKPSEKDDIIGDSDIEPRET